MANKFTRFLNGAASGLLSPRGLVSDYRHATRIFIDDSLRLSPKHKFSFYVRFEFADESLATFGNFTKENVNEAGILVKRADMPSYAFETTTLNQYNRKKILYTMLNYNPINITLHDDTAGVTNALWAIYYGYYVRDRSNPNSAYTATQYASSAYAERMNFRYGLDNNTQAPLLRKIHLYTMGRRRFTSYSLVNPKITTWDHSDFDHSLSEFAENTLRVEYEAVQYGGGLVEGGNPEGFTTLHYDNLPSPLTVAGGGTGSLLGEGGVLDGLEGIFGTISEGNLFDSPQTFLGTAISAVNTYQNFRNLSTEDLRNEAVNILSSPAGTQAIANTISGVAGAVFPKNNPTTQATPATQRNLTDTQGSS